MPGEILDALDVGQRAETWRGILAAPPDGVFVLVFERHGQVRGFVSAGPHREEARQRRGIRDLRRPVLPGPGCRTPAARGRRPSAGRGRLRRGEPLGPGHQPCRPRLLRVARMAGRTAPSSRGPTTESAKGSPKSGMSQISSLREAVTRCECPKRRAISRPTVYSRRERASGRAGERASGRAGERAGAVAKHRPGPGRRGRVTGAGSAAASSGCRGCFSGPGPAWRSACAASPFPGTAGRARRPGGAARPARPAGPAGPTGRR